MVAAFTPPGGVPLGHRKNHAKGICFTGVFEANGAGSALSRAQVFASGRYPALGRFNLGTPNPDAPDATVRVRGMGLRISPPDGQEWRAAMINPPVFPVSTPQGFYELLNASKSKDPDAMKTFVATHPEFAGFGEWATKGPWTGSYAEERYNSLDSFIFTDGSGTDHAVRWSLLPAAQPVAISPEDLAKRGPDALEQEITERVRGGATALDIGGDRRQSGRSHRRPDQGVAGRSPHRRGRHAHRAEDRGRGGRPLPRHQFRSDRPAGRDADVGRSLPSGPVRRLCEVIRPSHGGGEGLSPDSHGHPAMIRNFPRFTPLQRLLHWLMAACILAMLFIGVGMVSTVMPKYLPLVSIHKSLGIAILVLALIRLGIRLRFGAPSLPADLPEPVKLAAHLSH